MGLYHFWQTVWFPQILEELWSTTSLGPASRPAGLPGRSAWWPADPPDIIGYHLFFVALPEEMFYRGYMQSRLDEVWRPRWRILGADLGVGWLVTCVVFAFGHSLVVFQWWHFAIFFPSLVFGWLRARTGDVMAGAFFHAWCNIGVVFLDTAYGIAPL